MKVYLSKIKKNINNPLVAYSQSICETKTFSSVFFENGCLLVVLLNFFVVLQKLIKQYLTSKSYCLPAFSSKKPFNCYKYQNIQLYNKKST